MQLPEPFAGWFATRGWTPHPHQLTLLAERAPTVLLIAPTGAGQASVSSQAAALNGGEGPRRLGASSPKAT